MRQSAVQEETLALAAYFIWKYYIYYYYFYIKIKGI